MMEYIKELKLAIYESSLDNEDKYNLIDIVESTDDKEILSDVVNVLEASATTKYRQKQFDELRSDIPKIDKKITEITNKINKYSSIVNTTPSTNVKIKIEEKLDELKNELTDLKYQKHDITKFLRNNKTSKHYGKMLAKVISDDRKNGTCNRNDYSYKYKGEEEKSAVNDIFNIDKTKNERKPGSFV